MLEILHEGTICMCPFPSDFVFCGKPIENIHLGLKKAWFAMSSHKLHDSHELLPSRY